MIHLLAKAKNEEKRRKMLRRFIWGRRVQGPPKPMTHRHVYRIYNANDKCVGEYPSQKILARNAFNGALSRDEIMQMVKYKLTYNGHRIVKEKAPEKPLYYKKSVMLSQRMLRALELISINHSTPPNTLIRNAVDAYINQELEKLPDDLREYL